MRVLVIDDQPLEGEMISLVLGRDCPGTVYAGQALSASQGLSMAASARPELIFLDINMPGMDGISAISRLRELCRDVRIVMITAYDDFPHIQAAMRAGANDYLLKPVRPKDVRDSIERWRAPVTDGQLRLSPALLSAIADGDAQLASSLLGRYLDELHAEIGEDKEKCRRACAELIREIMRLGSGDDVISYGMSFRYQEYVKAIAAARRFDDVRAPLDSFISGCAALLSGNSGSDASHRVEEAKRYVEDHLGEEISLASAAGSVYLSTAYFSRLFKEKAGCNFSAYLAERRVERARNLLDTTPLSVAEISRMIGYREANSFSRLFKSITGMSPSEYRGRKK